MKKSILFTICFVLLHVFTNAQDSIRKRTKEYYVSLAGINPVNMQLKFKKQIGKKTFFKIGLVNLSLTETNTNPVNTTTFKSSTLSYSGGLELGMEFRQSLSKRFDFFHGPNIGGSYNYSEYKLLDPSVPGDKQRDITTVYRGSVIYAFGVLFKVTDNFLVAGEINPTIYVSESHYKDGLNPQNNSLNTNNGFSFGTSLGIVSLVFRP